MKILLINKYYFFKGGADKYFLELADLLRSRGHEVAVFSMKHPQNLPSEWAKYFVDYVDYYNEKGFFKKIIIAAKLVYNRQAKKNLEKLINDFRPDIAHLQNIYHQLSPSIIFTLKKYKIPMIMTLHDYKLICPNYQLLSGGKVCEKCLGGKYYNCALNKCAKNSLAQSLLLTIEAYVHGWILNTYSNIDLFVSPSVFMKKICVKFGVPDKKIKVLPNFVNLPKNKMIEDKKVSSEDYFLYFGRLSPEKGVSVMLKALKRLGNGCRAIIVGNGPSESELKMEKEKLNLDNVEFVGPIYGEKLYEIINNARAVIVPSIWYENMPYVIIETMLLGKIVIASNLGGIGDLIQDKENGFLFEAGNDKDLADKIKELNDYNLIKISQSAKKQAFKYNSEIHYAELISLYDLLTSRHK